MFSGVQPYLIDKMDVLSNVDQKQLFFHYVGLEVSNKKYFSLFRRDSHPGCRFEWLRGVLYFIENTRFMNRLYWDIFHCISYLRNISYADAIRLVATEYGIDENASKSNINLAESKIRPTIRFVSKSFEKDNLFKLDNNTLNSEGIFLVDDYWVGRGSQLKKNSVHNPKTSYTIAYYFPDSDHTKLYWPFEKENRWYSNCDINDVFGKYKLEYYAKNSDYLIITKSQKDRIILDYHLGFPAIAVQNEGSSIGKSTLEFINNSFEKVYVLYDNDDPGIYAAEQLSTVLKNSKCIFFERGYKDTYENFIKFGNNKTKNMLQLCIS